MPDDDPIQVRPEIPLAIATVCLALIDLALALRHWGLDWLLAWAPTFPPGP